MTTKLWNPQELAEVLGVTLPGANATEQPNTNGRNASAPVDTEPFRLDDHPRVRAALRHVSDPADRSVDQYAVVGACHDAGLTLAQARWAVNQRADLAGRLGERKDNDVLTCWLKIDAERRRKTFSYDGSDGDGTDGGGEQDRDTPRPEEEKSRQKSATRGGDSARATAFDPLDPQNTKDDTAGFLTDANISELLVNRKLRGKYCWVPGLGWMRWDGAKLARTTTEDVIEQSRLFAAALVASAVRKGDPSKVQTYTRRMNAGAVKAAADLAKGQMLVKADLLDQHPDLLNVANGVINLRTGELMAHDPRLLLTKCAPTNYYPDATHADWTAALEALPADVREWMQERFGQAITGNPTPDDMLPVLHGSGANGKTTIVTGITRALGEHAVIVPDRVLLSNPGDHPTEMMTLRGARMALLEETPEARRLNVKRLKDVLGTPVMTARYIRQDSVSWAATHSLFVSTNYRPRVEETDHGTWRRLAMVTFPLTYRKADEELTGANDRRGDPTLRERIKLGGDGRHEAVLAWLVKGAQRFYANGQVMSAQPRTVVDDTRAWRHESDLVLRWFDEALIADEGYCVSGADLYNIFAGWLTTNGNQKWSSQTFADRFGQLTRLWAMGLLRGGSRSPQRSLLCRAPTG